jgi:hypothetical protein
MDVLKRVALLILTGIALDDPLRIKSSTVSLERNFHLHDFELRIAGLLISDLDLSEAR